MAGLTKWVADSLSSLAAGLGGLFGGRQRWYLNVKGQAEIEAAYRQSWLARKIHDIPPYDMTRAWRDWQTDKDRIEAIEAEERRLKLPQKVRRALTLARLHGGGALILGLPGNPNIEVDPERVAKGALGYVHVVSRYQLTVNELEGDVTSPYFGQPKLYTMSGTGTAAVEIHPSRVIPFIGQPLPEGMLASTVESFWGDPLMQSLADAVDNSDDAQRAIIELLKAAKVDIITIPDLMGLLGTAEYEQRLLKRITLAQSIRDSSGTLLISGPAREGDPGEKWETRELSFTGLPDLAKIFLMAAAGGADIPATRLLGQSPDGMNATGESDLRNYYDMIASRQATDLEPTLDPLDDMLLRSVFGNAPSDIHYNWASLWQLTPEQQADVADKKSKAIKAITDTGLVPTRALEEGVQNMLIEDGLFPGLEAALEALPDEERFPSLSAPTPEELAAEMALGGGAPGAGGAGGGRGPGGGASRPAAQPREPGTPPRRAAANDGTAAFADAAPRTLYVRRDVLNAAEILAHFKAQGFETLQPADALPVTVAFSRKPVDWMTIAAEWAREANGHLTVAAGGPRIVEKLGDKGAVVLLFNSLDLFWRHKEILNAGAGWDFPTYQPHITLTYQPGDDLDLATVKPWTGEIRLGEEIFEEVVEDWESGVTES